MPAPRRSPVTNPRIPSRLESFLPRPRLDHLLDVATTRALTIVTGPAGVGKTSAVADWTRSGNPPGPVVWVNLRDGDTETEDLWETLAATLISQLGEVALRGLSVTDPGHAMLAAMAANAGGTLCLVLDGCEKLSSRNDRATIDRLIAQRIPGLRIVMLSRHDPVLSLHRLRLENDLGEVRFQDLAFTVDEARDLLAQWNIVLTDRTLNSLVVSTGGWAAALRLAAFSLQRCGDPKEFIEHVDGVTFLVSNYVWDEVLGKLPTDVLEFLELTSVSRRLCGPMARALSGNPAAHRILSNLATEELLVQEEENNGWYRTHPLLSRVLRARLREQRPQIESQVQRRAVQWFEDNGDPLSAIAQVVETRDWDLVGQVALRLSAPLVFSARQNQFADILARTPPLPTHDHGELAVAQALRTSLAADDLGAESTIGFAEALLPTIPPERRRLATVALRVAQALVAHRNGDTVVAHAATAQADEVLSQLTPEQAHSWTDTRPMVAMMRVAAALWAGDPSEACRLSRLMSEEPLIGNPTSYSATYHLGLLAFVEAIQGGLIGKAHAVAHRALDFAMVAGRLNGRETQFAWLTLSITAPARGDFIEGRTALERAREAITLHPNPHMAAMAGIAATRMAASSASMATARRHLAGVDSLLFRHPGMVLVADLATVARVEVELMSGSAERARAALDSHVRRDAPPINPLILAEARTLLAEGASEAAQASVATLLEGSGTFATAAWLVVSRAEERRRRDSLSIEAFSRAVDTAVDQGNLDPFLHAGAWISTALHRHATVVGSHHGFVLRALTLVQDVVPQTGPVREQECTSLTERELSVLLHLPGMSSNAEIATALHISANTVKQHLKSTYRKLDVGTRRDAVRVARDRGLLSP